MIRIQAIWLRFCTGLICLLFFACSKNTISPQFEPEISNKTDTFEFQATSVENISQTLQYTWQNTGKVANINQANSLSSGTATITIKDASGAEVYNKDLKENGTFVSGEGTVGAWRIVVNLSGVDGTLNFRAEKRTQ